MLRQKIITTALALLLVFPSLLAARAPNIITEDNFIQAEGRGLTIQSDPPGVRVFINGIERGITPVGFENMGAGEYQIRLVKDGYNDKRFNVTLSNTGRLVVLIKMEEERGFAMLSVYRAEGSPAYLPFNPQITSREQNEPPPLSHEYKAVLNFAAGVRTIRVRAFGWEDAAADVLIRNNETTAVDIYMRPAVFSIDNVSLSRNRFNPFNTGHLGITDFRFDVSAPGTASFRILNAAGAAVFERQLDVFDTWYQSILWNGRDSAGRALPEGVYTILMEASAFQLTQNDDDSGTPRIITIRIETEIDYSVNIFPLSLDSGISGLSFTPLPHTLPLGSFQFNAGVLAGNFILHGAQKEVFDIPFKLGMSVTPVNHLELTTIFNINPYREDWGITGSVKYNFLRGDGIPLAFAAGVSYTWAGNEGAFPLSPGRGVGFFAPLSLELTNTLGGSFSLALCPILFWRGPEGLIPALMLGTGILYRAAWLNAGLSARLEYDLTENTDPSLLAGAQIHFYPLSFVFSLQGGVMSRNNILGWYGGITIGFIY
ncbi:MAG: PEGA domain-containing protein [Treponema sp.]|nr:PEGA domain-containing protein [Treponema sp.]MCL2245482.1 PEGA domain-containing protein [Treponema sp.]